MAEYPKYEVLPNSEWVYDSSDRDGVVASCLGCGNWIADGETVMVDPMRVTILPSYDYPKGIYVINSYWHIKCWNEASESV